MTVYEKRGGAQLYVEWWDDMGRHQKALGSLIGEPVTDKDLAKRICRSMADAQENKRNAAARQIVMGHSPDRTVSDLLAAMHKERRPEWSASYRMDQKRFRSFWEDRLGKTTPLVKVNPATVNLIVRREAEEREWSEGTQVRYLRYIVDAFYYGQKSLKWISESHNLSAVRFPKYRSKSRAYTKEEVLRLLPALEDVDARAGFVGHVAWQTGRRLNAIRLLGRSDVRIMPDEDVAVITFPSSTDKARDSGEAVIAGRAVELLRELLSHGRDVLVSEADGGPVSKEALIKDWLPAAEAAAEIEHVDGRAFHGIKRRWATRTEGMIGRDKQAGTLEPTLKTHYVQDDLEPKIAMAKALAREVADR